MNYWKNLSVLGAFLERAFRNEFSFVLDDVILYGTVVGQPLGILNSPAYGHGRERSWSSGCDDQRDQNHADVRGACCFIFSDCRLGRQWRHSARLNEPRRCEWKLNLSASWWTEYGSLRAVIGLPCYAVEQAETLGTDGDIMLVDFSKYLLADKGGVQTSSSIHVTFIYDETVFRLFFESMERRN